MSCCGGEEWAGYLGAGCLPSSRYWFQSPSAVSYTVPRDSGSKTPLIPISCIFFLFLELQPAFCAR